MGLARYHDSKSPELDNCALELNRAIQLHGGGAEQL